VSELDIWATIGMLALATAATRSSFWLIGHHITIPKRVQDMLRYAPACALAAIIAPDLLIDAGHGVQLTWSNPKLIAAIGATGYYLLRRSMLETIIVGMIFFTALRVYFH
jgi:branched-subunit amino acid transport protein